MEDQKWKIYRIEADTVNNFDLWRNRIIQLYETMFEKGIKMWWNYYGDHIRIGVLGAVIEQDGMKIVEIPNPDLESMTPEIAEEINWIKFNACLTVQLMNYGIPPSKLYPSSMAYFIHLLMNALGASYQFEALNYAWLTLRAEEGILEHYNKRKEDVKDE